MTSRPPSTDAGEPTLGYRSLLAVRGYPAILAAQAVSRAADSIHYVALVALIFSLTDSGLSVSIAVVFEALPVVLLGVVAGAVVDRMPRRRVMVTADLSRCVLAPGAFALNAATFLLSALLLLRVREPAAPAPAAPAEGGRSRALCTETRQGIDLIRAEPFIRRLLGVQLLAVLSVGGTRALLVVLATEQLGVDESDFGLLVAALGVGAFIGPLLFGRLVDRLDSPVLLFIPYLVRGVIDAALAFLTGFWIPAALLLLYGINTSTGGVAYTTLLQRRVPAEYRGRVFSAFNMVWQAGRLASLALAGLVADVLSVQALYVGARGAAHCGGSDSPAQQGNSRSTPRSTRNALR